MNYAGELKPIMSAREVADFLGIGVNQVYNLVRAQKIKALPLAHRVRISRRAVLAFIGEAEPVVQ